MSRSTMRTTMVTLGLFVGALTAASAGTLAVRGGTVHTMAGEAIVDGVVVLAAHGPRQSHGSEPRA